jgi:hypothetical protein
LIVTRHRLRVFAAYGWLADLAQEAILARLLALNLARAEGLPR